MIVALIDNGSLEPASTRQLRNMAAALSARTGVDVAAVSWKHSDRIAPTALDQQPAWTLGPWLDAQLARRERDFVLVPFFVSPQGAVGSRLRRDLERRARTEPRLRFTFTSGLSVAGAIPAIVAARVRETLTQRQLHCPPVVVVDHGGPSTESAAVREHVTAEVRRELGDLVAKVSAASMEGAEYPHNQPLLADLLGASGFDRDVVIAPLFLSPGRHAGPGGDLAGIARAAEDRHATPMLRCHFTDLIGNHPLAVDALAHGLYQTLSTFPAAA